MMDHGMRGTSRREVLLAGIAGVGAALIRIEPAAATPESMKKAIRQVVGESLSKCLPTILCGSLWGCVLAGRRLAGRGSRGVCFARGRSARTRRPNH